MEEALFITKIEDFKHIKTSYSRLYFGNEFCEHLIPNVEVLTAVLERCKDKNMALSVVTPFVTDAGIEKLKKILDFLRIKEVDLEIVINDFGVLDLVQSEKYDFNLVLGRLLSRQKRDSRIDVVSNKLPAGLKQHFSFCYLDREEIIELLLDFGIKRIELDNLSSGIRRSQNRRLKASLYYPYAYISTTRLCPARKIFKKNFHLRLVEDCNKECRHGNMILKNKSIPYDIILKGNTYFRYIDKLPLDLDVLGIDRIIYQPEIPL